MDSDMAEPQEILVRIASADADESRAYFMAAIKHRIVGANAFTALDDGRFMVISGHLVPAVANPSISAYAGNTWFLRPCQTKHFCLSDPPFARRTNRILPLDSDVVSHVRPCISHGRNLMI
jgi:hypothetical protein